MDCQPRSPSGQLSMQPSGHYNSAEVANLVQLLFTASLKLDFPVTVAARASLGLHKYLKVHGATRKNADATEDARHTSVVLLSALLFAYSKACEHLRSVRDVVNVVKALMEQTQETGDEYRRLKADILMQEQLILRALNFDLDDGGDDHYKYLLNFSYFLQQEQEWDPEQTLAHTPVSDVRDGTVKTALTLLNDFFLVSACIEHPPAMAAAACLCIALAVCVRDVDSDQEAQTCATASGSGYKAIEPDSIAVKDSAEEKERSRRRIMREQSRLCRAMHVSEADMDRTVSDIVQAQLLFTTDANGKIIGVSTDSQKPQPHCRKERNEEEARREGRLLFVDNIKVVSV